MIEEGDCGAIGGMKIGTLTSVTPRILYYQLLLTDNQKTNKKKQN
jgi:hypothetical protein